MVGAVCRRLRKVGTKARNNRVGGEKVLLFGIERFIKLTPCFDSHMTAHDNTAHHKPPFLSAWHRPASGVFLHAAFSFETVILRGRGRLGPAGGTLKLGMGVVLVSRRSSLED